MTYVTDLVRHHARQFIARKFLAQAGCNCDGGVGRVTAGGEGVHRRVVDQIHLGQRCAGGDTQLLNDVEQLRIVFVLDLHCSSNAQDRFGSAIEAPGRGDDGNNDGDDGAEDDRGYEACNIPAAPNGQHSADRCAQQDDQQSHAEHEECALAFVSTDEIVEGDVGGQRANGRLIGVDGGRGLVRSVGQLRLPRSRVKPGGQTFRISPSAFHAGRFLRARRSPCGRS